MNAVGELVDVGTLAAQVENADLVYRGDCSIHGRAEKANMTHLRLWYTTVVPGLRVGLILAIAVAASGTATHF